MKTKRSNEIELWRFIFAVVIVSLHSNYLPAQTDWYYFQGGSIGVEYFFIVTGFFLAKSVKKQWDSSIDLSYKVIQYTKKKINTFFPYMIFALIVSIISKSYMKGVDAIQFIKNCIYALPEVLLLKSTGMVDVVYFNGPAWYLSTMLIGSVVLYTAMSKGKKLFSCVIAPISAIFILGFLFHEFGHFRNPEQWTEHFNKGFLRGIAEMALGIFCEEICEKLKKLDLTVFSRLLITTFEYAAIIGIIIYSNTESCWDMENVSLLMIAISVIIAGSDRSLLAPLLNRSKFIGWLGKFSLMLYLNHIYWFFIFTSINLSLPYNKMFILYIGCSFASALICWGVVDFFKKYTKQLKRLFIKENLSCS